MVTRNSSACGVELWAALMHVVNKGFTLMVPPLLEAKADLDMRAPDGATALFMAAVHGHSEIIALLMEAGADISTGDRKGKLRVMLRRQDMAEWKRPARVTRVPLLLLCCKVKHWRQSG